MWGGAKQDGKKLDETRRDESVELNWVEME